MPKKKKKQQKRRKAKLAAGVESSPANESRVAEGATVAWMLSTLATLVSLLLFLGLAIAARVQIEDEASSNILRAFAGLMLLTGAITGAIGLVLLPLVYKLRTAPPPQGVAVIAGVIDAFPPVCLAAVVLWSVTVGA